MTDSTCLPLPQELLIEIAKHISSIQDLASFTRACRQTHQATIDELYRAAIDPCMYGNNVITQVTDPESNVVTNLPEQKRSNLQVYTKRAARAGNTSALARMLDLCPAALVPYGCRLHLRASASR